MSIPIVPMGTGFSDAELSLLKKKIEFSVIPANILATEIIAKNVKSAVRRDHTMCNKQALSKEPVFIQYPTTKPNITKEQWNAFKSLKEVNSIMILPADKGCVRLC